MNVFVGLGNPGSAYDGTRHNIGFAVVDMLEGKLANSTGWKAGRGSYYFTKGTIASEAILLVKPTTYMNHSGRAVRDVLQFYKAELADLCVIADDIALPLGKLRLRPAGSDGGHNGLASVILELGSDEFARLRCGVGSDFHPGDQARYVLSKFKTSEKMLAEEMATRAADGCLDVIRLGFAKAMNTINVSVATG